MAVGSPIRKALRVAVTLAAGAAMPLGAAQAGGFAVREQSAYFQGVVFAGAAAGGPSISSMFWNPAVMTQAAFGFTTESSYSAILGVTDIHPTSAANVAYPGLLGLGGGRDISQDAIVPASYLVWRPNERWAFGFALNAPFGLVTNPSRDTAFMFYSRLSRVFTVNLTPQVAYKVNEWLSVGVGLQAQYFSVRLENAMPGSAFPPGSPGTLVIDGEGTDLGVTAGVTITPTPWTSIGVGFRSGIDQEVDGDIRRPAFTTLVGGVPVVIPAAAVGLRATVPLPDTVSVGVRQKVSESFTVLGTFEWTRWSRLGRVTVNAAPAGVPGIPGVLAFDWENGWFASGGVEYQWSPELALRAGIGFEHSPVRDETRGTRLPDNDRTWLGAGLTYTWSERLAFDLGYSHIFVRNAPIAIGPGHALFDTSGGALGTFSGSARSHVDIVSIGLRYRWGGPAPAAPLITKG